VNGPAQDPRETDEWRVEVTLEDEDTGRSLGDRLRVLDLDDEARERLGGSVTVTRDGPHLFLYAWHEPSAREAEKVVRDLMEEEGLAGEVRLVRWHPVAEEWRPADEPLPQTEEEVEAEQRRHEEAGHREHRELGVYPWEVVVHLPSLRATMDFVERLEREGLPMRRRWRYVQVGADTEEDAVALGKRLEGEAPEGSQVGIRANPEDLDHPTFVLLGSLKPGVLRDLGL
jgi:hypothetical protein